jgi:alkylhydroperoxidase/carboxymuconolactone decarboxylase family protein YurZ
LRKEIREALARGVRPRRLDEAFLQLVAFAGYGRAITAFAVWREFVPRPVPAAAFRPRAGERLCRRIYGPVYARMMARMRGYHPQLAAWILDHGYGQVLARPGLSLREREGLALVGLGALGLPVQQESHLRGFLRCGGTRPQIRALLKGCGLRVPEAWA